MAVVHALGSLINVPSILNSKSKLVIKRADIFTLCANIYYNIIIGVYSVFFFFADILAKYFSRLCLFNSDRQICVDINCIKYNTSIK